MLSFWTKKFGGRWVMSRSYADLENAGIIGVFLLGAVILLRLVYHAIFR